jgi:hypothetical protein
MMMHVRSLRTMPSLDPQTTQKPLRRLFRSGTTLPLSKNHLAQAGATVLAVFSVIGLGLFFLRRINAALAQLEQARKEAEEAIRRISELDRSEMQRRNPAEHEPSALAIVAGYDYDYAAAVGRADRDVVEIIAALFIETAPGQVSQLGAWLACGNAGEAWRLTQALRSTLEAFNADPALELIGEIDQRCQQGALADAHPLIGLLEREVSALCSVLKRLTY